MWRILIFQLLNSYFSDSGYNNFPAEWSTFLQITPVRVCMQHSFKQANTNNVSSAQIYLVVFDRADGLHSILVLPLFIWVPPPLPISVSCELVLRQHAWSWSRSYTPISSNVHRHQQLFLVTNSSHCYVCSFPGFEHTFSMVRIILRLTNG